MQYEQVCLEGFGTVLPPRVVTSLEIEERLAPVYARFGVHAGRLELMSGVRERRFFDEGVLPSDAAAEAGRAALAASGVTPDQIGAIFHTGVSRDCIEPATASFVHEKLGLGGDVLLFDISNACLGFADGMIVLANMIELGQVERGLIVAGESGRQLVESTIEHLLTSPDLTKRQFKDAFASLTIGSGAAALVMAHESVSRTGHRLLGGVARAATEHSDLCQGTGDAAFTTGARMIMSTDSETLLEQGCRLAAQTWEAFKLRLGWSNADVDHSFTHQVGVAHRERLYEVTGLDAERDFSTLEFLGNVGSVSLPLTMAMGTEKNPPVAGDRVALLGIGSGLSCAMLGVEW